MSTGTTNETDPGLDLAHQWCREMRAILGNRVSQKLGRGDAARLAKAESAVHNRLEELHELFPEGLPKEAQKLEHQYAELAREGQALTEQYHNIEQQIKDAKQKRDRILSTRTRKEKFRRDKTAVRDIDAQIKSYEQLLEKKKQSIADQHVKYDTLSGEVMTEVNERVAAKEQYKKDLVDKSGKDGAKAVLLAQKEYKTAAKKVEKLIAHFQKNCDAEATDDLRGAFDKAKADIYEVLDPGAAQRVLGPMVALHDVWAKEKDRYSACRKRFEKAYKSASRGMKKAEGAIAGSAMMELVREYTAGQTSALDKNWPQADGLINDAFIEKLESAIEVGLNGVKAWESAVEEINDIKTKLDELADPQWNILALTPLGPAYKLADQCDYIPAVDSYQKNKSQAQEVLTVAGKCDGFYTSLKDESDGVLQMIDMIPLGTTISFLARQHRDEVGAIPDNFWEERHQSNVSDLEGKHQEYAQLLATAKTTVQGYTDPENKETNDALVNEIESGKNVAACISLMNTLLAEVHRALSLYEAFVYDASATSLPEALVKWKEDYAAAEKFTRDLEGDHSLSAEPYVTHRDNLRDLPKAIDSAIQAEQETIQQLQSDIQAELRWLKAEVFGTRLDTFKEATWHKETKVKMEELAALAKTTSPAVLRDTLQQAQALRARCEKVFGAMGDKLLEGLLSDGGPAIFEGTKLQIAYDALKSRLKAVRKPLMKTKDYGIYISKTQSKVADQLSSVEAGLRSDGYVGLADDAAKTKHTEGVVAVEKAFTELKTHFAKVKAKRDELENELVQIRERVSSELVQLIREKTGASIAVEHLPVMKAADILSDRLTLSEDLAEFASIEVEIGMLLDDVTLLFLEADEPGAFQAEKDACIKAEQEELAVIRVAQEKRIQYESDKEKFLKIWKVLRNLSGIDKGERDTIKSVKDTAIQAAKSKPADWTKAAKNMALALRLAERLEKDPIASQTTDRGRSHLKELTPRWTKGIDRLNTTVKDGLGGAIVKSCDEPDDVDAKKVGEVYGSTVVPRFEDNLIPSDFEAELLVLSRKAPLRGKARKTDHAEKKKKREQALVKVRKYKRMVQKDLMYQTLLFKSNPWSSKGGAVDGLPLMRSLNDLELNIERGIY